MLCGMEKATESAQFQVFQVAFFSFNENFLQDEVLHLTLEYQYPIVSCPCKHDILLVYFPFTSCFKTFPSEMEGLASEETTIKLCSIISLLHTTFISVGSLEGQN